MSGNACCTDCNVEAPNLVIICFHALVERTCLHACCRSSAGMWHFRLGQRGPSHGDFHVCALAEHLA